MREYFPNLKILYGYIKVELDLSHYAAKAKLIKATSVNTSNKETHLSSLKLDVEKLDIDKLKAVPVNLSKLGNVINNVIEETEYNKLVTKFNVIDTNGFVLKTFITMITQEEVNNVDKKKYLIVKDLLKTRL